MEVVAINYAADYYSISSWRDFWKALGGGDVVWAQDVGASAMRIYQAVLFAGTSVIVNRQGRVAYRDDGITSYEKYREEIEKVL